MKVERPLARPASPLLRAKIQPRGDIAMGLVVLILGLILVLCPHVLVTMRPQRAAAVKQLGERAYKGLFAALSIAGL
jgi:hypothetical protein